MKKINMLFFSMFLVFNAVYCQERTVFIKTDSFKLIQDYYPNIENKTYHIHKPTTTLIYVEENNTINDTIGRPYGKLEVAKLNGKYLELITRDTYYGAAIYFLMTKIDGKWVIISDYVNIPKIEGGCCSKMELRDFCNIVGSREFEGVTDNFECKFNILSKNYTYFKFDENRKIIQEKKYPFIDPKFYPNKKTK